MWVCFIYFSEESNTQIGNSNYVKYVLKIYLLGRLVSQGKIRQNLCNYDYTLKTFISQNVFFLLSAAS